METVKLKRNLEEILKDVNSKFINIDNEREEFATHFDHFKNELFDNLRKFQPLRSLFNGFQMGGSYGDGLKVKTPNEFDMVFHLKFPESRLLVITPDRSLPGNVHINFTNVFKKISNEKQHKISYKYIRQWVDENNFLVVEKLQSYLDSCFTKVLRSHFAYKWEKNNMVSNLHYRRCGPAHTIFITPQDGKIEYSVDFVPGILLNADQNPWHHTEGQWEVVPKPSINPTSFRSSFYRQEQTIISNKLNLKNALRMMKKFRDAHQNMLKMKSYFIKTLFLWKDYDQNDEIYWRNSLTRIIIDMFSAMENSLENKSLKYFWDPELNMYDILHPSVLEEMLKCVRNSRIILQKAEKELTPALQKRVYNIFCTSGERYSIIEELANLIQNITIDEKQSSVDAEPKKEENSWCVIA